MLLEYSESQLLLQLLQFFRNLTEEFFVGHLLVEELLALELLDGLGTKRLLHVLLLRGFVLTEGLVILVRLTLGLIRVAKEISFF